MKKEIKIDKSISQSDKRKIDCLRCKIHMKYNGEFKFHEGFSAGMFGGYFRSGSKQTTIRYLLLRQLQ